MRTFETPMVEVQKFDTVDILTASTETTEEELPEMVPPCMGL